MCDLIVHLKNGFGTLFLPERLLILSWKTINFV